MKEGSWSRDIYERIQPDKNYTKALKKYTEKQAQQ
jgi:hypothetical protein